MSTIEARIAAIAAALVPLHGVLAHVQRLTAEIEALRRAVEIRDAPGHSEAPGAVEAVSGPDAQDDATEVCTRRFWCTPPRRIVLLREYAAGTPMPEIRALLEPLPGDPLPDDDGLTRKARMSGANRPPGTNGRPVLSWRTPGRAEILRRDWPAGVPWLTIAARMHGEPGPEMPERSVLLGRMNAWAAELGLKRPVPVVAPVVAPAEVASVVPDPVDDGWAPTAYEGPKPAPKLVVVPPTPVQPRRAPEPPPRVEIKTATAPAKPGAAVLADPLQIDAWAAQRGLRYDNADSLEPINARRESLGLPVFELRARVTRGAQ